MWTLLLSLCVLASGAQSPQVPGSRGEAHNQEESTPTAESCESVFNRAISLNESFKNAVSAGGQRVFGLEAEKYYRAVLLKEITGCVTYASTHADAALSRLVFDLAYSYSNSADTVIPRELARVFSEDPERTKVILLSYEAGKRHELIEILKSGLRILFEGKPGAASRMGTLTERLLELESD